MASRRTARWKLQSLAMFLAVTLVPLAFVTPASAAPITPRIPAKDASAPHSSTFASKTPARFSQPKAFKPSARGFKEGVSREIKEDASGKLFRNADGSTTAFINSIPSTDPQQRTFDQATKLSSRKQGGYSAVSGDASVVLTPKRNAIPQPLQTPRANFLLVSLTQPRRMRFKSATRSSTGMRTQVWISFTQPSTEV